SAYQSHRRQQIQVEDNTYVEAEWRIPRRLTESESDSVRPKMNDGLKLVRLAAFGVVSGAMVGAVVGAMGVMVATQRTWQQQQQHWEGPVLMTACIAAAGVALLQLLNFARRKHLPRFPQLQRSRKFFVAPIILGLCTLWFFNFRQFVAHTAGNTFN